MRYLIILLFLAATATKAQDTISFSQLKVLRYDESSGTNISGVESSAYSGLAVERRSNDQVKRMAHYENGKIDGKYQVWFENGQLEMLSHYKKGKRNGELTYWFSNGQMRSQSTYFEGNPYDTTKQWYKNGQLKSWTFMARGDTMSNAYQLFWEDGKIKMEYLNTYQKVWHQNGELKESGGFLNNKKNGKWLYYNARGKRIRKEKWHEGVLNKKN